MRDRLRRAWCHLLGHGPWVTFITEDGTLRKRCAFCKDRWPR